jgi:succinate dehydrogenase/fumarate reductase cytochrome b subunit
MIKYVAVLAVIALMISGVMYMFSDWEEEKTKKAKSWILWSLTAVVLSISSYYIVTTIAWIQIGL